MERGFYNDEFEELLKQKADQYKMYPSDQVWKGINRSLHTRKKWYWFSFLLFLAGITYYAIIQLITPSSSTTNKKPVANNQPPQVAAVEDNHTGKTATVVPFYAQVTQRGPRSDQATPPRSYVVNPDNSREDPNNGKIVPSTVTIQSIDPATAVASNETAEANHTTGTHRDRNAGNNTLLADKLVTASNANHRLFQENALLNIFQDLPAPSDETAGQKPGEPEKAATFDEGAAEDEQRINWLQQFAVYNLSVPKLKRLSWQLSFAPTMNYRKLRGNDASMTSDVKNVPIAQNVASDPNKLVNHKPALGFELGSHFLYAVNKDLQIRAGAQFNYSRYAIQAYGSYSTDVATIALNSAGPSGQSNDSLTNYTRIRNFGGDVSEDLQNQYFQLSIPVGLELRLLGAGKVQIGVSGTIQPTYLINRQTYLITTDYKNYTKEPSLVRRWNVNTGAEIFLAYKSGDLRWQVGPQFRYQLFSSYVEKYPIREYLMEYGIKIGVTKTIR